MDGCLLPLCGINMLQSSQSNVRRGRPRVASGRAPARQCSGTSEAAALPPLMIGCVRTTLRRCTSRLDPSRPMTHSSLVALARPEKRIILRRRAALIANHCDGPSCVVVSTDEPCHDERPLTILRRRRQWKWQWRWRCKLEESA